MKKISSAVLILILLLLPTMLLSSCQQEVIAEDGEFYGTIEYVNEHTNSLNNSRYFVYVSPLSAKSDIWIPFVVHNNEDVLTVGSKVKITYSGTMLDGTLRRDGFVADSIELTDAKKVTGQKNPLAISDDYVFDRAEAIWRMDFGTVIHVVRVESGASGYLVYLVNADYSVGNLTCYWIDDNAIISDEAADLLSKGKTNYQIDIRGVANSPYEDIDIDIEAAVAVSLK